MFVIFVVVLVFCGCLFTLLLIRPDQLSRNSKVYVALTHLFFSFVEISLVDTRLRCLPLFYFLDQLFLLIFFLYGECAVNYFPLFLEEVLVKGVIRNSWTMNAYNLLIIDYVLKIFCQQLRLTLPFFKVRAVQESLPILLQ